jgi:hypothetical protein
MKQFNLMIDNLLMAQQLVYAKEFTVDSASINGNLIECLIYNDYEQRTPTLSKVAVEQYALENNLLYYVETITYKNDVLECTSPVTLDELYEHDYFEFLQIIKAFVNAKHN